MVNLPEGQVEDYTDVSKQALATIYLTQHRTVLIQPASESKDDAGSMVKFEDSIPGKRQNAEDQQHATYAN